MNWTSQARRRSSSMQQPPPRRIHIGHSDPLFDADHEDSHFPSFRTILTRAKRKMRSRQYLVLLAVLAIFGFTLLYLHTPHTSQPEILTPAEPVGESKKNGAEIPSNVAPEGTGPPQLGNSHPIWQLVKNAEKDFNKKLGGQSKTLKEAVAEYRRRYGIPPPPHFDKWYNFAKAKNVQLIDEYDSIHQSLLPFWGLKPATVRGRAREALGYPNKLIGALVRKGEIKHIEGGGEWQMEATKGMMKNFVKWLPDMDLCFNTHDEPRVMVPYDDLSRLVRTATDTKMPAANAVVKPRNSWSKRPSDLSDGMRVDDMKLTRFNIFAHQATWTHSRMSCPPDSPSRNLEDGPQEDNLGSYAVGELGFIYNNTAFSDICQSPSFSSTYGFFDRPNAYSLVHDLFPIFSQSKISSYSDIIYPSPWYWAGKVSYNETMDMSWAQKEDHMYWRGSTTGGFSRDGGWRRQHRQHVVQKINAGDQAKILVNSGGSEPSTEEWHVQEVPRSDYKSLFDIFFSHVGQCDPGDCNAQKEFFTIKEAADQQSAWKYKHLLDMDGNAFSGRFYAFLKSRSLVYKLAVFREWHEEWLKPWMHFVPLSLRGEEWVEATRWFAREETGKREAERIALAGREWAGKVLRNADLEVWFFRLLLEYVFPPFSLPSSCFCNQR